MNLRSLTRFAAGDTVNRETLKAKRLIDRSDLPVKLLGMGEAGGAQLGYSVALSSDADTAIVGGFADSSIAGAAWVFMRLCVHADANGDGLLNVNDVFYLINFLFAGGPAPMCY